MRTAPPDVVVTKESRNVRPKENLKIFIIAVTSVLSVGIILFVLITQGSQIEKTFKGFISNETISNVYLKIASFLRGKPKILYQGNAMRMLNQQSSILYFADLEYEPKTGLTRQIKVGTYRGDQPRFLSNQPNPSAEKFIYKVEVWSNPKEILSSGWFTEYRKVVGEKDGKVNFRVLVSYRPNSIIKVYMPNKKLLWTGQTNRKETVI